MKISQLLCLFALLWGSYTTQAQSTLGISPVAFKKSQKAFETGKETHHNSYEYTLYFASFSGYFRQTTFVVKAGEVIERRYETGHYYRPEENKQHWTETGTELGSHTDEGEPVKTLDQVYADAQQWLSGSKDPKGGNTYYFDTDEAGILTTAGYRFTNCMDDCFKGFKVRNFKWL